MNKDRVVFFPILGKMGIQVQAGRASVANGPEAGLSAARGALAACFAAYYRTSGGGLGWNLEEAAGQS